MKLNAKLKSALQRLTLLQVLLLSLAGCSTPPLSPSSPVAAQIPSKPIASTPQPLQPYSVTVKTNIEAWDEKLKATLTTP